MKKTWTIFGRLVFLGSWPALWVYLRFTTRTRVVVTCGSEILLVKGWHSSGKWSLPGGGVKRGELPLDCAVREVKEETGVMLNKKQLKQFATGKTGGRGFHYKFIGFAVQLPAKPAIQPRMVEIIDCQWLPIKDLRPSSTKPSTLRLLSIWRDIA